MKAKNQFPRSSAAITALVLIIFLTIFSPKPQVGSAAPLQAASPFDLIAEVNNYRLSQGIAALEIDNAIMSAAQKHSEYQAFIGSWTHTGPGGSNETDRVIAEGYGGGKKVVCDEAVAVASATHDIGYVIYTLWADSTHRDLVILNSRYRDVGAGVAEQDGKVYYTLDVCVIVGEENDTRPTTAPNNQTPASLTQPAQNPTSGGGKIPIQTSTTQPDGSIVHVVQQGQTLWDIAIAYGKKIIELAAMNGLSATSPVVYVNQKIVVQASFTPTITPTITNTTRPPTRTPRPSRTAVPTRVIKSATVQATITQTQTPASPPLLDLNNRRSIGMVMIIISGLGLILVGLGSIKKKVRHEGETKP